MSSKAIWEARNEERSKNERNGGELPSGKIIGAILNNWKLVDNRRIMSVD